MCPLPRRKDKEFRMTVWAKILCFLVLLLSIAFLGFEAVNLAKKEDWRQRYAILQENSGKEIADLKKQVAGRDENLNRMSLNLNKVTTDMNNFRLEAAKRSTQVKNLSAQVQAKDIQLNQLSNSYAELTAIAKSWEKRNEGLRKEREKLSRELSVTRSKLAKAQEESDGQRRKILQLTTDLDKTKTDLTAVTETLKLREDTLAYLAKRHHEVRDVIKFGPVPDIRGQVLQVDEGNNLVLVNVGFKHGVKKNHEFTVFRHDQFVAKIRIFEVDRRKGDLAAGRIILKGSQPIRVGDHVATRVGL